MRFNDTEIHGLHTVSLEPHRDSRGSFCELYSLKKFLGFKDISLINISVSREAGTIRGLHYQKFPFGQIKYVVCLKGRIFDVAVDIRQDSPTYGRHFSKDLHEDSAEGIFIPFGLAHGWQAISDEATILYVVFGTGYEPKSEMGLRYNDPKLGIKWPLEPTTISERDGSWPLL